MAGGRAHCASDARARPASSLAQLSCICEDRFMRREDYVFCIGYEGSAAIVDLKMRARYGSLSTRDLAEHGLYKQALCSAIHSEKPEELAEVLSIFNAHTDHPAPSVEGLLRIYGVTGVPDGVTKITLV
jgi:hypothetical protein